MRFLSPEMQKKLRQFKKNRIAFGSLCALLLMYAFSLLSPWLVNDEPLILHYEGKTYFPAFVTYAETEFGGIYETEPDYPKLIADAEESGKNVWALMPLIEQDPLKADLSAEERRLSLRVQNIFWERTRTGAMCFRGSFTVFAFA